MKIAASGPTLSETLVAHLADLGVRHAFGVSGGAIAPLWAALSASAIGVAHFRHESGAAFAAIEAHFATGEPVVVFTTTGPGLTNALTGLLAARDEGAKIIVLSGCTAAAQRGKWPIQGTRADTFLSGLFHFAATLEAAEALPQLIVKLAHGLSRPGCFIGHLALPTALQASRAATSPVRLPPARRAPAEAPSAEIADRCAALLADGKVALWLGFGARRAAAEIRALAERLGAAVMCSPRAKGVFPENHPLFVGVTGVGGHRSALHYMEQHRPDRILVLGTRLGEPTSFWDPVMVPAQGFIHVDIDPDVPGVAYPAANTVPVRADVRAFVSALLARVPACVDTGDLPHPDIGAASGVTALIHPAALMQAIQRCVIDAHGSLVLAECGNAFAWATHLLRFRAPGQYRVSTGVGAMGHCAAGVVGAAHATGRRAVSIVGDGALLMNNEINTAVALRAPATWIVLNDSRYNMCEQGMAALGLRADASMPPVDFGLLARALGATSAVVSTVSDLDAALIAAVTADGPSVLDVRIDPPPSRPPWDATAGYACKSPIVTPGSAPPNSPRTSQMESNTFATSAYIASPVSAVHAYLCNLKNLDEWTLGSRMVEQVDDSTWIGTASGYQRNLYYHVRSLESPHFCGIEWQCGYEYRRYFKSYPVLLFPADYLGSSEPGTYLHWVSVIDPAQRTPMIMQGIQTVHNSEVRALKAALERQTGLTEAAHGQHRIAADTIYIDAPLGMATEFLGDLRTMPRWSHLLKPVGPIDREHGSFLDEYRRNVEVTLRTNHLEDYVLVEQDYRHPEFATTQRSPTLLIPLAHAFGDPTSPGVILHRITFWNDAAPPRHGKLGIEDFGAENMNIKRLLEAKAGNLETFARGQSYIPQPRARELKHATR